MKLLLIGIAMIFPLFAGNSSAAEYSLNFIVDDSGTAPDAILWLPQQDTDFRGPLAISQNLAAFSTVSYPGETDPTMFWGYNHILGGFEQVYGEGAVYWGVEGNYRYDPGKPALMEAYVHFVEPGTTVGHRPIMIRFDKGQGEVTALDFVSGHNNLGTINFYGQASGGDSFLNSRFRVREWTMYANDGAGDMSLELKAPGGSNHSRILLGSASIDRAAIIEANSNTHLYIGWNDSANPNARLHLRRKDGENGDITALGVGGNQNSAVLGVTQANATDNTPALMVRPKSSTTVELVRYSDSAGRKALTFDTERPSLPAMTIHDTENGAIPRYKLHKNGFVAVREAGNTTRDRIPTTGTTAIAPSWANKPGSTPSGVPKWFPILDAEGNLYWVPGFPD